MIALDSNVLIYFLTAHPEFGESSRKLLVAVEQTSLDACASELAQYEVLSFAKLTEGEAVDVAVALGELDVAYRPISRDILASAACLRRLHGFGAMDAIHVASAIHAKATHFVTNDQNILSKHLDNIELVPLADSHSLY